jgi:hypothetical protein
MKYEKGGFGLSFQLPDGWQQRPEGRRETMFWGPDGRKQFIQLEIGQTHLTTPESREEFLLRGEPEGTTVKRTEVGGESNAVVMFRPKRDTSEISVVHDGIHYVFTHSNDPTTQAAINVLGQSLEFPPVDEVLMSSPHWRPSHLPPATLPSPQIPMIFSTQVVSMPAARPLTDYSSHVPSATLPSPPAAASDQPPKKWWEIWKR